IFANLLHNALKFTPKMGWVTISSARRNHEVVATITDTGPGFTPEECSSLFEKYHHEEVPGYRDGAGLGLYIVKALIDAHVGRIEVDSAPGSGSCFSVFLPIARNRSSEIAQSTELTTGDLSITSMHATTLT